MVFFCGCLDNLSRQFSIYFQEPAEIGSLSTDVSSDCHLSSEISNQIKTIVEKVRSNKSIITRICYGTDLSNKRSPNREFLINKKIKAQFTKALGNLKSFPVTILCSEEGTGECLIEKTKMLWGKEKGRLIIHIKEMISMQHVKQTKQIDICGYEIWIDKPQAFAQLSETQKAAILEIKKDLNEKLCEKKSNDTSSMEESNLRQSKWIVVSNPSK